MKQLMQFPPAKKPAGPAKGPFGPGKKAPARKKPC